MDTIDINSARKLTLISQAALAALAIGGAMIVLTVVPRWAEPPADISSGPTNAGAAATSPPPSTLPTQSGRPSMAGVADRLMQVANHPKLPDPPKQDEAPTEAAPSAKGVKYLGAIIEAERRVALLSIDGRQAMVAEGQSRGELTVVAVEPESVRVKDRAGERDIAKEKRSGSVVTFANGSGGSPAVPSTVPPTAPVRRNRPSIFGNSGTNEGNAPTKGPEPHPLRGD